MRNRTEVLVVLLILTVAVGFRFFALDSVPPGLYPDEAMNGNNALYAAQSGDYDVFYPENNGREGLYANIQAFSIKLFGNTAWALRAVSALMGVLTVLGTYLLTRRLFNNRGIAALAALLMATGFWHVNFSRIGFRAIMAPLFAVWSFYYLYTALQSNRLWHWGLAGVFMGLGMHTYIAFRIMPLAALAVLVVYWHSVRKDFAHGRYTFTRKQLIGGVMLAIALFILVAAPLLWYFAQNPGSFTGRTGQVSVLASDDIVGDLATNIVRTLGMFVIQGDVNWRHNLSGEPILFWPIAALFAVGLARSLMKVGRVLGTHGHFSTVHTLLLGWFFIGLAPTVLSNEGIPHALRAIMVAPPVYIFAAEGLWWLFSWLKQSYAARDKRMLCVPHFLTPGSHGHDRCTSRSTAVAFFTLAAFLLAVAAHDASAYFRTWGQHPFTAAAFNENYADVAKRINDLPEGTSVFVLVEAPGVLVPAPDAPVGQEQLIPMPAQTIMYLTNSWSLEQQKKRDISYVLPDTFNVSQLPRGSVLFRLQ